MTMTHPRSNNIIQTLLEDLSDDENDSDSI